MSRWLRVLFPFAVNDSRALRQSDYHPHPALRGGWPGNVADARPLCYQRRRSSSGLHWSAL